MNEIVQLHSHFFGEVRGCRITGSETPAQVAELEDGLARYAVLVFRGQNLDEQTQLNFSNLFGDLHQSIASKRTDIPRRMNHDALSDISNVDADGTILPKTDPRRIQQLANLIWHTDNSFRRPASSYTLLAAHLVPPIGGETEFADTRAAYDALPQTMKSRIAGLEVEHSLNHSRILAGTGGVFDATELARFPSVTQPLVRRHERSGRDALYIGSHAMRVVGWSYEDSQALLGELLAFATRPQFVYQHRWSVGELVMWDNRSTIHRGLPFDDVLHRRDLRRTSTRVQTATGQAA